MSDKKNMAKERMHSEKKPVASTHPAATEQDATPDSVPTRTWSIDAIFWGLLLVTLGTLLLLGNLGVIEVNWNDLWRLWPLFIMAAGFSLLATAHWFWKVLSVLFVGVALVAVVWVGAGFYTSESKDSTSQTSSVKAERDVSGTEITLKAGASTLDINSSDMSKAVEASLEGKGVQIEENVRRSGSLQKIELSSKADRPWWPGSWDTAWDVTLSERVPLALVIDAGASRIDADLSNVKLRELSIDSGASHTEVTLGDRTKQQNVKFDGGASSTTLRIPKESGISVTFDGGLSSRDFDGLEEVAKGKYQTKNYESASRTVVVDIDGGLSSFRIERY